MTPASDSSSFYVTEDEIPVVVVEDEVDFATAPVFSAALDQATAAAPTVVVDLTECPFMDSSGLHVLLKAQKPGLRLALACAPDGPVARLLDLAARDLVEMHDSRDAAVAALTGGSGRAIA